MVREMKMSRMTKYSQVCGVEFECKALALLMINIFNFCIILLIVISVILMSNIMIKLNSYVLHM